MPTARLTPGMFGRIQISTSAPAEALLVPDTAIGTEQVRKFVYAVDDDDVATPKYVTLGPVVDGLRVVKAGLERRRSRHRQRPDARAPRRQGYAAAGDCRRRHRQGPTPSATN